MTKTINRRGRLSAISILAIVLSFQAKAGPIFSEPFALSNETGLERNFGSGANLAFFQYWWPSYSWGTDTVFALESEIGYQTTKNNFTMFDVGLSLYVKPLFTIGQQDVKAQLEFYFPASKNSRQNSLYFNVAGYLFTSGTVFTEDLKWTVQYRAKVFSYKYKTKRTVTEDITRRTLDDVLQAFEDNALNDLFSTRFRVWFIYKFNKYFSYRFRHNFEVVRTYSDVNLPADWYGVVRISNRLTYHIVDWAMFHVMVWNATRIFDGGQKSLFTKSGTTLFGYFGLSF